MYQSYSAIQCYIETVAYTQNGPSFSSSTGDGGSTCVSAKLGSPRYMWYNHGVPTQYVYGSV